MTAALPRRLAAIVAVGRGGAIGVRGGHLGLPWHIPEDLAHFKATTRGHAVIMGRRTHAAIGRALPKRRNLVLSRRPDADFAGCETCPSLSEALSRAWESDPLPFVVGGASVYAEALPQVTDLHLTEVDRAVDADAFFPEWPEDAFDEVSRWEGETPGLTFRVLRRRHGTLDAG